MEQFPREVLCDWAGTTPEIVALYVCGSRAQGTGRPDSDLDLAVEVKGGSFGPVVKFVLSRVRWIEELRTMTGIPVKDLELIEVSKSVKDPSKYIDGTTCQFEASQPVQVSRLLTG
jgi:predicted nucleotidyltransferase